MNECYEDALMHSVMKNMPFNGRTSLVKKLNAKKCIIPYKGMTSTSCFNISNIVSLY